MNTEQVIKELSQEYPGKRILKNPEKGLTEIVCEIEPAVKHAGKSVAIAVAAIDRSESHYHRKLTEIYEVLKGELILYKDNQEYRLKTGDRLTIQPGEVHFAIGKETWVKVYSEPGWTLEDHISVE